MRFSARQTIALRHVAFSWRAKVGPLGCISVIDALTGGRGLLDVRLFGMLRLAHADGPATDKGEIMRYLAELAWAPDAILANGSPDWTVIDERTLRVAAGDARARGEVAFHLDDRGRVASIRAEDRPAMEGKNIVERPWIGKFADYREHQGRWLPFAGEVAWVLDGQEFVYWRGKLIKWSID